MKNTLLLYIIFPILVGCSQKQSDGSQTTDTMVIDKNTITTNEDTINTGTPYYEVDHLKDFQYLESTIANQLFDSITKSISNEENINIVIKSDTSCDDCCANYKKISGNKSALYFFKHDCGDYGYGSNQFFFINDTLQTAREFSFGPGDSALFSIDEYIYIISKDSATIKHRKKSFANVSNYTIDAVVFKDSIVDRTKLLQQKIDELKQMLEGKN